MKVYDSEFINLDFDSHLSILERRWKPESGKMTEDQFRHEMLKVKEMVERYSPNYLIGNTKNFNFVITPDIQVWADKEVYSQLSRLGVTKMAFVQSKDFYSQLSIKQAIEESEKSLMIEYFPERSDALDWLMQS